MAGSQCGNMIIYVDIDETICVTPHDRKYKNAIPRRDKIEKINRLHEKGHTIVYWTARGSRDGEDFSKLTYSQLVSWGARFDRLETEYKKPYYDVLIDDRTLRIEEL